MKKIALLLSSVALTLLLIEAGVRWAGYDLNPAPLWQFDPALGWTIDPQAAPFDNVNAMGFRFRPVDRAKPAGHRRLLVLGDSFTAATHLAYAETYPGRLEEWLNQGDDRSRWEVISLAVDDWGSAQQLQALSRIGLDLEPDGVVLQTFPFNDFCNNTRLLAYTCSLQDEQRPYFELRNGALVPTYLHPARAWFRNHFHSFGLLENLLIPRMGRLPREWVTDGQDPDLRRREFFQANAHAAGLDYEGALYAEIPDPLQPASIRQAWQTTGAIFAEIAALTAQRRLPLIPLVIPFSKTFEPDWSEVKQILQAPMEREYGTQRFEAFFQHAGLEPISVRRRIEEGPMPPADYFISPHDGHLNAFGHAQVAAWISQQLSRLGIPDLPPPWTTRLTAADALSADNPWGLLIRDLGPLRRRGATVWRQPRGEAFQVAFWEDEPGRLQVTATFELGDPPATVAVIGNGQPLEAPPPSASPAEDRSPGQFSAWFPAGRGRNQIDFVFRAPAAAAAPIRITRLAFRFTADAAPDDAAAPKTR